MTKDELQAPFWRTYEAGRKDVLELAEDVVSRDPDVSGAELVRLLRLAYDNTTKAPEGLK